MQHKSAEITEQRRNDEDNQIQYIQKNKMMYSSF